MSKLNLWTPRIELTQQELREAQLVKSGQMRRLIECAEIELMKVTVSFRNEFDTRAAEKIQSDCWLKQDFDQLMIQVHQTFIEIDTAISRCSQTAPPRREEHRPHKQEGWQVQGCTWHSHSELWPATMRKEGLDHGSDFEKLLLELHIPQKRIEPMQREQRGEEAGTKTHEEQ